MALRLATEGKVEDLLLEEYYLPNNTSLGGVIATNYTYVQSNQSTWAGNSSTKIQINIPQEMISLKDAYLEFQITGNPGNTASINCSFVPDIRSIFTRMTLQFGSKTILDIFGLNVLQNVFNYTLDPQWANTNGAVLVASNSSQSARQAYFLNANKVYSCRLGFCEGIQSIFQKIIPFNKTGVQMQMYLYLADPQYVISTDIAPTGTVLPSYTVNTVQLHYYSLVPTDQLNALIDQRISSNPGISFVYRCFDYQQDTNLLPAGVTSASKFLTYKYSSFLGLFLAFQPTALPATWTADNKLNFFFNPGINVLRLKVGGAYYPTDSVTDDSDVFGRWLLMTGVSTEFPTSGATNWNYNGATPSAASFIATCPVSKHPNSIRMGDERIEDPGLDIAIATSVQLDLGFTNAIPSGGLIMHMWAYYNAVITINRNGSVTLYT